jgi:hypothetical protein
VGGRRIALVSGGRSAWASSEVGMKEGTDVDVGIEKRVREETRGSYFLLKRNGRQASFWEG